MTLQHAQRKRAVSGIAFGICCALLVAGPVHGQESGKSDDLRQQLDSTKQNLRTTITREETLASDAVALAKERASINAQLIEMASQVQAGESQLTELETRLGELTQQRKLLLRALQRQNKSLGSLLAALQRMGRNPPPVIATPEGDALAMVRSAMLLAKVFPELRDKAKVLTAQLDQLNRVVAEIETRGEQLKAETDQIRKARESLASMLGQKRRRLIDTKKELAEVRRLAEQHRKSVASLNELIVKLDQTVSEKAGLGAYEQELAEGRAPGQETVASAEPLRGTTPDSDAGSSPTKSAPTQAAPKSVEIAPAKRQRLAMISPGRIKPALPFGDAHGQLAFPAKGKRIWGFGDKTRYGNISKGIAVETRHNAQITSPNDGWVVYAGPFLGFGQLLIVNAGGGYHILLAGMAKIDVVVGQFVLSGEPVGKMAGKAKPKSAGEEDVSPVFYVEFRRKGRPIDPDPWWTDGPRKVQG